jgi:hypothetical protein
LRRIEDEVVDVGHPRDLVVVVIRSRTKKPSSRNAAT